VSRERHGLFAGVAVAIAAVIYGPMLAPGFPLRYDLVSVPRPVLGEDALGLGDRLPRAIPLDAAVALLAKLLPDTLLTQLLGLLALTLAGWGVAVLTPTPLPGRLLALLVAEWNPFVLEQLAIGHLPHLFGYGALPWVAVFGRALVRSGPVGSGPGGLGPGRTGPAWSGSSGRWGARSGPGWSGLSGLSGRWRAWSAWGGLTAAAGFGSLTPGGGVLVVIAGLAGLIAGWAGARSDQTPSLGSGQVGASQVGASQSEGGQAEIGQAEVGQGGVGLAGVGQGEAGGRDLGGNKTDRSAVGGCNRRLSAGLASLVLLQLPWLVAAAVAPGFAAPAGSADSGITAFSLRSETGWGRLVDAAGLAGMWNQVALPASRDTVLARVSTVLLLALAAAGLPAVRRLWQAGRRPELLVGTVAAGTGYLAAVLPVLPGGEPVLRTLIDVLPGAGLLRDGHRWLGLPAIALAVLCGLGASEISSWSVFSSRRGADEPAADAASRGRGSEAGIRAAVAVFAALLIIASMPDLAGGLSGRLRAREFPAAWAQARAVLDESDDRARVLILPWQPFRVFAWSGPDPVLDPAPRLLPRQSIVSDALTVSGRRLPEEGLGARAIAADLVDSELSADGLRSLAVGWVLIERGTPGRLPILPPGWTTVLDGPELTLLRAPQPLPAAPKAGPVRAIAVLGTQSVAGILVLLGLAAFVGSGITARRIRRTVSPE
jgi:hypothetical protein